MIDLKKIKKHSFIDIVKIFLSKFLKTSVMKFHYLKTNIDSDFIKSKSKEFEDIESSIKELTYDDFLLGDKTVFNEHKLQLIRERLNDKSYKSFGIISNGLLVYSTWISLEKLGLPFQSKFILNPDEGLLEDSYCHPSARGKRLHSKMNILRLKKLYEFGKKKCIVIVLDGNTPAFKVQYKSGFKNLGTFYGGKILGIPFNTLNKSKYDDR